MTTNPSFSFSSPQFIAEIGLNHNGDFDRALRLLEVAIECGSSGVNFYRRSPSASATGGRAAWAKPWCPDLGMSPQEAVQKLDLGDVAFRRLREAARGRVAFWGTPFDLPSLEFFDTIEVDGLYVPSGCNTDFPFLDAITSRGCRLYISTGSCDGSELQEILRLVAGCDVTLMHGVACLPVPAEESHLEVLGWLNSFGLPVGYDDHELGNLTGPVAAALGASVLQKGLTLDHSLPGPAHSFCADPVQFQRWIHSIRQIFRAVATNGDVQKKVLPIELPAFDEERRCVVAAVEIPRGAILTEDMLTTREPMRGLTPRLIPTLLGRRALYQIPKDEPITFGLVDML